MQNQENKSTSHTDVIPAIVEYVREAYFQEEIQNLPIDFQDIFEMFLESEHANQLNDRLKLLNCLNTIRAFAKSLAPFTKDQVEQACAEYHKQVCHV